MTGFAATLRNRLAFVARLIVLVAVARIVAGVVAIIALDRDALSWGIEITAITAIAFVACFVAALAVRRYAPPHGGPR